MADVFTGATSAAGSGQLSNQVLTSYVRNAYFALREDVVFDQFASVRPGDVNNPGNPVKFVVWSDLSVNTTALTETVDVDAVGLSDNLITVTPAEYGIAVVLTTRIRTDDFLIGFDSDVSNILNENMVQTIEELARTALDGGTYVEYAQVGAASGESDLTSVDTITAALVAKKRAQLRGNKARPWDGSNYMAVIHPDVLHDLVVETGAGAWATMATYGGAVNKVWNYEFGSLYGFRFIESANCYLGTDAGSGSVDSYGTYFFGQQCLAKAVSIPIHMVPGPQTDRLRRFTTLGWTGYLGYDTFRELALRRIVSASSIGTNT